MAARKKKRGLRPRLPSRVKRRKRSRRARPEAHRRNHSELWGLGLVALYMMVMALITVVATYFARETFKSDIADSDAHLRETREPTERFVRKPVEDRETEPAGVA